MWLGDQSCFGYQSKWLTALHYTDFTHIVLKLSFKYTRWIFLQSTEHKQESAEEVFENNN